ncbi:unnamed protein product [Owenia fusiformis]|uniref:Uncharacterized protein n=1 Tax=Owenia fusiformis TaxID=6347 RepID=A0A8S4PL74_OWEFU|nr:unnamed protein product [Owenia fusiformis]
MKQPENPDVNNFLKVKKTEGCRLQFSSIGYKCTMWGFVLLILTLLCTNTGGQLTRGKNCSVHSDCGWNTSCDEGTSRCLCRKGYYISDNQKDCYDPWCQDKRCVECYSSSKCRRCIDFIEVDTGECVSECQGEYILTVTGELLGKVCQVKRAPSGLSAIYIGIIAGVCCVIVITVIIAIVVYWRMKKTSNKKQRNIAAYALEAQRAKQMQEDTISQSAYNTDTMRSLQSLSSLPGEPVVLEFLQQIDLLKPHKHTLVAMWKETKDKLLSVQEGDSRIAIYKNVIQQLTRVLNLLHKKPNQLRMPPDGNTLLKWAERILKLYIASKKAEQANDSGYATISKVYAESRKKYASYLNLSEVQMHGSPNKEYSDGTSLAASFSYENFSFDAPIAGNEHNDIEL